MLAALGAQVVRQQRKLRGHQRKLFHHSDQAKNVARSKSLKVE
jgi:hypothetical protein